MMLALTWLASESKVLDEHVLKKLLDFSSEIHGVLDSRLRFLYVNKKIRFLGYTPKEVLGRSISVILREDALRALEKALRNSTTGMLMHEVILLSKDGTEQNGILNCVGFLSSSGKRSFLLTIRVKRNFSVHNLILDSIDSGVVVLTNDDRIIYANKYAKRFFGIKETMPVRELPSELRNIMYRAKNELKSEEFQLSTGHVLGVSSYPLLYKGQQKGWIVIFRDITETKRLREGIALLDKFSTLGVIASGLAHEIKNPLASMKLTIQNLEQLGDKKIQGALERLQRQIDRIDSLVRSFFSYVRPSPPNPGVYSVKSAVNEVITLVENFLKRQKIKFVNLIPSTVYVIVDFNQFQQILLNLILNAIDAMPNGGNLVIRAGETEQGCPQGLKRCVYITVEDTGVGIPQDKLDKIFLPFFSTKKGGIGLGLFIVYQLVNENKGRIEVESHVGAGTKFTIFLPSASAAMQEESKAKPSTQQAGDIDANLKREGNNNGN